SFIRFFSFLYVLSFPTRRSSDLYTCLRIVVVSRVAILGHFQRACSVIHLRAIAPRRRRENENANSTLLSPYFHPTVTQQFAFSLDRKSTRLNSSHQIISYAVFCL